MMLLDYEVQEQLVRQGHAPETAAQTVASGRGAWLWRNAKGDLREWRRTNGEWRIA